MSAFECETTGMFRHFPAVTTNPLVLDEPLGQFAVQFFSQPK